ncbi:hypothetical protein U2A404230014 [Corynebacterium striatum]|nr:hypothetical protein U2A404230014 [Corynebacterium striatum]
MLSLQFVQHYSTQDYSLKSQIPDIRETIN